MSTIQVTNSAELTEAYEALSGGTGGTILLEAGAMPYEIIMKHGGDAPVRVTSADADNPAHVTQISLEGSNITIDNIYVNSSGVDRKDWIHDVGIFRSDNITIENVTFESDADGLGARNTGVSWGENLARIEDVDGLTFANNTISNYFSGLTMRRSENVTIEGNDISALQGDGIQMEGVHAVDIVDNHFHNFYGSTHDINHDDMIQIWDVANTHSSDILIDGNRFISSDGAATQTIFVRNETVHASGQPHTDITVSNNLIYNGHLHGIVVNDTDGVLIANNTLLWDRDAFMYHGGGGDNWMPRIAAEGTSTNIVISENITVGGVSANDGAIITGTIRPTYSDIGASTYVGKHFVNALSLGEVDLRDLRLLETSEWTGTAGSPLTAADTTGGSSEVQAVLRALPSEADLHLWSFDARFSTDATGFASDAAYSFVWTFENGDTREGQTVSHMFDTWGTQSVRLDLVDDGTIVDTIVRDVQVANKNFLIMDFEDGIVDLSGRNPSLQVRGNTIVEEDGNTAFRIGGHDEIQVARSNAFIHNMDSFSLSFDIKPDKPGQNGTFLFFYKVMEARIVDGGYLEFVFGVSPWADVLRSNEPIFTTDGYRNVAISYDGAAGTLAMLVDGIVVAEASDIRSQTRDKGFWGLIFGNDWGESLPATIDNIYFGDDPNAVFPPDTLIFTTPDTAPQESVTIETITDFDPAGSGTINLSGMENITDFNDLMAEHIVQIGPDVIINDLSGHLIVLESIQIGEIDAGDFLF